MHFTIFCFCQEMFPPDEDGMGDAKRMVVRPEAVAFFVNFNDILKAVLWRRTEFSLLDAQPVSLPQQTVLAVRAAAAAASGGFARPEPWSRLPRLLLLLHRAPHRQARIHFSGRRSQLFLPLFPSFIHCHSYFRLLRPGNYFINKFSVEICYL
jgi:hypothetical protein